MPAARQRSRSPFMAWAVRAMIGMCPPVFISSVRMAAVASKPPNSGIWTSMSTTSKRSRGLPPAGCGPPQSATPRAARAAWPSPATVTAWPCFSRRWIASFWLTALSSASNTRRGRTVGGGAAMVVRRRAPLRSLRVAGCRVPRMASRRSDCETGLTSRGRWDERSGSDWATRPAWTSLSGRQDAGRAWRCCSAVDGPVDPPVLPPPDGNKSEDCTKVSARTTLRGKG
jgi:hypothetical protein